MQFVTNVWLHGDGSSPGLSGGHYLEVLSVGWCLVLVFGSGCILVAEPFDLMVYVIEQQYNLGLRFYQ